VSLPSGRNGDDLASRGCADSDGVLSFAAPDITEIATPGPRGIGPKSREQWTQFAAMLEKLVGIRGPCPLLLGAKHGQTLGGG
jgi:hypothetical protein